MTQLEFLKFTIHVLEEMGVTYLIVGSFASSAIGEPRFTRDIDIVVSLIRDDVPVLCRAFHEPDFYLDDQSIHEAMRHGGMFNVLHPESGNKIDFMIARTDLWGRHEIANRRRLRLAEGLEGYVASPEDVIIGKLLYYQEGGSDKHLRDIAGILKCGSVKIDHDYITRWVVEFGLQQAWRMIQERARTSNI